MSPPTPSSAPAQSTAAAAAAAGSGAYTPVAFEDWGSSLKRSPISATVSAAQKNYIAIFGFTGYEQPAPPAPAGAAPEKGEKKAKK